MKRHKRIINSVTCVHICMHAPICMGIHVYIMCVYRYIYICITIGGYICVKGGVSMYPSLREAQFGPYLWIFGPSGRKAQYLPVPRSHAAVARSSWCNTCRDCRQVFNFNVTVQAAEQRWRRARWVRRANSFGASHGRQQPPRRELPSAPGSNPAACSLIINLWKYTFDQSKTTAGKNMH